MILIIVMVNLSEHNEPIDMLKTIGSYHFFFLLCAMITYAGPTFTYFLVMEQFFRTFVFFHSFMYIMQDLFSKNHVVTDVITVVQPMIATIILHPLVPHNNYHYLCVNAPYYLIFLLMIIRFLNPHLNVEDTIEYMMAKSSKDETIYQAVDEDSDEEHVEGEQSESDNTSDEEHVESEQTESDNTSDEDHVEGEQSDKTSDEDHNNNPDTTEIANEYQHLEQNDRHSIADAESTDCDSDDIIGQHIEENIHNVSEEEQ